MLAQRLKWACRRGMLELDLLLMGFLDTGFSCLSSTEQRIFEQLLTSTDAALADWLLTEKKPPPEFQKIITAIKNHARGAV
jgi:antitoxin CptB